MRLVVCSPPSSYLSDVAVGATSSCIKPIAPDQPASGYGTSESEVFDVDGEVLEILRGFRLAHVRASDECVYGLTSRTPGVSFADLDEGALVHMSAASRFRRVLSARLLR